MHDLEVALVIASVNLECPADTLFLVYKEPGSSFHLPCRAVHLEEEVLELANKFFHEVTGLAPGWITLTQGNLTRHRLSYTANKIAVPYGCMVPKEMVKKKDCYLWVSASHLMNNKMYLDHLDILIGMCKKI